MCFTDRMIANWNITVGTAFQNGKSRSDSATL